MISNKYINTIIATITAIAIFFTSLFYIKSKNITIANTVSSSNFKYLDTVLNKENITEIDIEVDEDNWNYLLENATDEEYINANITVNGTKYYNVGIRAKGNSSLSTVASDDTTDRYSFKVKFDEYVDGQNMDGLSKFVLNNIISDATYMKEYLSYDLLDKMGVPTPAFAFTNITINGEEWGLYFAVEVIEEEFIERNYGSLSGNLYKPDGMEMGGNKDNNENMKPNMNNEDMGNPPDMSNIPGGDNANSPNMNNMPSGDNTNPPNMDNIPSGDNANPPNMDSMPSGDNSIPPDMGNMLSEDNSNTSDINTLTNNDNNTTDTPTNNTTQGNQANINGFRGGMMGGGGGMGSSNGGSLVYTDDNKESYSDIFDSAVFDTTTDSDEDKVIEMIKNLNEGTNLEEYLNVDEILRYFAVNTFLVNLDSYASNMKHNYYLYERDGVFEILPWDYNLSFGGFTVGSASNAINFPIDTPVTDTTGNSPLIEKLLEVDEYKETYHKYLQEIVDYVNDGTYENTINSVNSLISEYVKNDPTAFYTYEEYEASLPELINFGIDRAKSISAQLEGTQPSTSYGTIETTVNLTAMGSQGGGGKDKNMNMQKPTDTNNVDTTTSASIENTKDNNGEINNMVTNDQGQMQPPTNNNVEGNTEQQRPMQRPNDSNTVNSNTSSSTENPTNNQGEMQNPTTNNETSNTQENSIQKPNNDNNKQQGINNNQERPSNMNGFSNNQINIKSKLLEFGGYILFLLLSIAFVALFKRKRFKAK
ncbi:CotH kinase family protein [Clostridium sp. Sa3CUN1]|uniref:CotH kinase family protein n=1 Tax=Clostridium gallinarum TaxID=2762246 RepID=A0ABR8Q1R1_9CLOT|nr:CotH kinase family protein [Clostridium gallinarum]MBD7914357.1 CotH kinase family protein [Clostridium gallinarum]